MRVFLAGGSGVIGQQIVPMLVAEDHEVVASARLSVSPPWVPVSSAWTRGRVVDMAAERRRCVRLGRRMG